MTLERQALAVAACLLLPLSACALAGAEPSATPIGTVSAPPVDGSIEPVSASDPGPEAAAVLKACNVVDEERWKQIAGMGRLAMARDLPKYTNLIGTEPEIQTDSPAWVIQFSGEIPQFRSAGEVWIDPICTVIDGQAGWYATGPVRTPDGTLHPAPAGRQELSLPPLAP